MTQRERNAIIRYQRDAFEIYLRLCVRLEEVPDLLVIYLISGCQNIKALKETIAIFESKK